MDRISSEVPIGISYKTLLRILPQIMCVVLVRGSICLFACLRVFVCPSACHPVCMSVWVLCVSKCVFTSVWMSVCVCHMSTRRCVLL